MRPRLSLSNRQRKVPFDTRAILRLAERARPACLAAVRSNSAPLARLDAVEVFILSDSRIARVHAEFFHDPTPTDVITFPHGEILLGAGVVSENARRFGQTADLEATLCFIHGLLHLAGWDDRTPGDSAAMDRMQEQVFKLARRML